MLALPCGFEGLHLELIDPQGKFLDAGCGSLLFTAGTYLESSRQIVGFDQSVAMLRRGNLKAVLWFELQQMMAESADLDYRIKGNMAFVATKDCRQAGQEGYGVVFQKRLRSLTARLLMFFSRAEATY